MCNILWVDNLVVAVLENLESRVGQDYRCKKYKHKVFEVLCMCHVLVWDKKSCDNAYLTHVYHVVCCVALETLIWETGLWNNIFSRPGDWHLYYVSHDTLCLSTFVYFTFFCIFHDL